MADQVAEYEHRLRHDTPFYARKCLRIVNQRGELVPFIFNKPQLRIDAALEAQAAAGLPLRVIILKARKLGTSTYIAGKISHRYTQIPNHKAVVVAHDGKTAGELFEISETMFSHLPNETVGDLRIKPAVKGSRRKEEIVLGEASRNLRLAGNTGLNSSLLVDTAGEVKAGRGFTYFTEHLSEAAFYPDEDKMTSLLNAVPDEPETMVAVETTANGHNFFRRLWKRHESDPMSDYVCLFFAWYEDENYVRPFISHEERERFADSIGEGEWGEAEPDLLELLTQRVRDGHDDADPLERLNWRRWAILNRCGGDLSTFHQEYPSTPDEAFLATGRQVFSVSLVSKVLLRCENVTPELGLLRATETETREVRGREVKVPKGAMWLPREELDIVPIAQPFWHLWERPKLGNWPTLPGFDPAEPQERPGQYVTAVDPASGEENEMGDLAYHAIQVIDHASLRQVGEYKSRLDPDLIGYEALLAALYWNRAWLGVEKTGGFGLSIIGLLWRVYHYPRLYQRRGPDTRSQKREKRLGWDTSPRTKPRMLDRGKELLRTGTDGIRSPRLASEMMTYVRDENGRTGPDADSFADLLTSWLQAQMIAQELPLRTFDSARTAPVKPVLSRAAGY